jgi:hypothetical protein
MRRHTLLDACARALARRATASAALTAVAVWTVAASGVASAASPTAEPAAAPPGSAIGNVLVESITVSPAYSTTGLVLATGALGYPCIQDCVRLFRSRDGGATWEVLHPAGWTPGLMTIASDAGGHETVFTSSSGLIESTDQGTSWKSVGTAGTASAPPTYSSDKAVAVADLGGHDYLLAPGGRKGVAGSGGSAADVDFAYSAAFPKGGRYSPALLLGADKQTKALSVYRCDASLSCSSPSAVPSTAGQQGFPASRLLPATDYDQSGTVFLFTQMGLYKSTDGGTTFAPLTVTAANGADRTVFPAMALDPGYKEQGGDRQLYAAVLQAYTPPTPDMKNGGHTAGGIYKSADGGTTWAPVGSADGAFAAGATAMAIAPDGRLFGGWTDNRGHAGLLCNTDGTHWRTVCPAVTSTHASQPIGSANTSGKVNSGNNAANNGSAGSGAANGQSDQNGSATNLTAQPASAPAPAQGPHYKVLVPAILAALLAAAAAVRALVARRRRPAQVD